MFFSTLLRYNPDAICTPAFFTKTSLHIKNKEIIAKMALSRYNLFILDNMIEFYGKRLEQDFTVGIPFNIVSGFVYFFNNGFLLTN